MENKKYIFDIETSGLAAIEDRITCISILDVATNEITSFYGPNERKILQDFFSKINGASEIIGYNIIFDLPFLIQRSLINNVGVCSNYRTLNTTDLRLISTAFFRVYNRAVKGTLDQWSEHLGLGKKKTTGEQMVKFYNNREYEKIKDHCSEDVKITAALYWRLRNCGLIK